MHLQVLEVAHQIRFLNVVALSRLATWVYSVFFHVEYKSCKLNLTRCFQTDNHLVDIWNRWEVFIKVFFFETKFYAVCFNHLRLSQLLFFRALIIFCFFVYEAKLSLWLRLYNLLLLLYRLFLSTHSYECFHYECKCAPHRLRLHFNRSIKFLTNLFANGQSDSISHLIHRLTVPIICLIEWREYVIGFLARHADTIVGDFNPDEVFVVFLY